MQLSYQLLGKGMAAIWGARRAVRYNTPSQDLGAVLQLLRGVSDEFQAAQTGDFFRVTIAFHQGADMLHALQRQLDSDYTQAGEPNGEWVGHCTESVLARLDEAESELRVWWVRLMRGQIPSLDVEVELELEPSFVPFDVETDPLSQVHGISPDPALDQALRWFNLMKAGDGIEPSVEELCGTRGGSGLDDA